MLSAVEVRTPKGVLLTLPLWDVDKGYIVESIEGLDPVKATLVSSGYASMDGAQYQSSRREPRNLKIRLGLEPDYIVDSVQSLRSGLYPFFMPKSEAKIRFLDTSGKAYDISGRVESFDTALFTKEPAVDISLLCYDPDFLDSVSTVWGGETTTSATASTLTYDGTVETGFVFEMTAVQTTTEFTIYHTPPDGTIRTLTFDQQLDINDKITLTTIDGSKGAVRTRSGVQKSMLYGITSTSRWLELQPGENGIRVLAGGTPTPFSISYTKRYGGL